MKKLAAALLALLCLSLAACDSLPEGLLKEEPEDGALLAGETWTEYSHDGVRYEVNSRCTADGANLYSDGQTGASYMVSVYPATGPEEAVGFFGELLGQIRMRDTFQGFQFEHVEEEDLVELTVDSGDVYQYNVMTVFWTNGSCEYVAVVVDGDLTVQVLAASPDEESQPYVKAELDRLLQSLAISGEAHVQAGGTSGLQTVGTEAFGYVSIPDTWVEFLDLDGTSALQYANRAGTSILTLNVIGTEGLTEEQAASPDLAEQAAKSVWYNLEQNDVRDVTGAVVDLNGRRAYQVYGDFVSEDHGLSSTIVCWILADDGGVIHYVSAEAGEDDIYELVAFVEASYAFSAPEDDSQR